MNMGEQKLKIRRIIGLALALIILFVGCIPVNQPGDKMKTETVQDRQNQENIDGSDEQKKLHTKLNSGFFYSMKETIGDKDGEEYYSLRAEAMDVFNEQVLTLYENCFELYDDGYPQIELMILEQLDTLASVNGNDKKVLEETIRTMYAFKASIEALALEVDGYMEADVKDEEAASVMNRITFETAIELFDTVESYQLWLSETKFLVVEMMKDGEMRDHKQWMADCDLLFESDVVEPYLKMTQSYLVLGNIYAHIASADYAWGELYLSDAKKVINELDETEAVRDVKELISIGQGLQIPSYIFETLETGKLGEGQNLTSELKQFLTGTMYPITSYATDADNKKFVMFLYNIQKLRYNDDYGSKSTEEHVDQFMLNTILGIPTADHAERNETVSDQFASKVDKEGPGPGPKEFSEGIKQLAISQKAREEILEKLRTGQSALQIFPLNSLPAAQYSSIIWSFTKVLEAKKGQLGEVRYDQLNQLLNEDLEKVLGNKKEDFVEMMVKTSAEEILSRFEQWQAGTMNFGDMKFDRDALIAFMDSMGIEQGDTTDIDGSDHEDADKLTSDKTSDDVIEINPDNPVSITIPNELIETKNFNNYLTTVLGNIAYETSSYDEENTNYIMTEGDRSKVVETVIHTLDATIKKMTEAEDAIMTKVSVSGDYTVFDVYVIQEKNEGFAALGPAMFILSTNYGSVIKQLFELRTYDEVEYEVNLRDSETGAVFETENIEFFRNRE